jgi:hypothetical protein
MVGGEVHMVLLLSILACASEDGFGGSGGGERSDVSLTGNIGGSGGGGGDTTTTTDSGTDDTTTDTGCNVSDLDFTLEAFGDNGVASEFFSVGDSVEIVATFQNGCADDIIVPVSTDCIVDTWILDADDGTTETDSVDCAAGSEVLVTGDEVENRWSLGVFPQGSFSVTAESSVIGYARQIFFTVQ